MTKKVSSMTDIRAALPAVRETVRKEVQARVDAGEKIASMSRTEMKIRSKVVYVEAHSEGKPKKSKAFPGAALGKVRVHLGNDGSISIGTDGEVTARSKTVYVGTRSSRLPKKSAA